MADLSDRLAGLSPEKRALLESMLRKKRAEAASSSAIPPRDHAGPFPLSFSQERLWLVHQLEPESPAYNIPSALRFDGELSVAALRESLAAIVRRHETLRTRFELLDGDPAQVIEETARLALPVVDLAGLDRELRDGEVDRLAREEALKPFDLGLAPLFRSALVRLAGREHLLLTSMHHIVSDGWSMGIFARELGAFYGAALSGRPASLPELKIQYADFALWQRRTLTGPALDERLAFWRRALAGVDPVLELPSDRPLPARRTPRGGVRPFALTAPLGRGLRVLGAREGTTLFMTLLAGFLTLLHRQTYKEDLCVGTPVAGRGRVETESLIGFFVDTLAVRADLAGQPSFREHLARVREFVLDAQGKMAVPFERLVSELAPERSLRYSPIFQVLFAFQNVPVRSLALPGIAVRTVELPSQTTKFDLSLILMEDGERLAGGFEYSLELFDGPTVQRIADQLTAILHGIAADPDQRLSDLPLLGGSERHQLLVEWGGAEEAPAATGTLHGRFEAQARRASGSPAVSCGGEVLSYGELNRRSNQVARRLRQLGVGPDVPVGLCVERSPELVVGILGILKAGGAYVPLDPNYPRERLTYMLADAGIRVVVGTEAPVTALGTDVEGVLLDAGRERLDRLSGDDLPSLMNGADGSSLAYVIYTSGSTGRPKGALVSHANVARLFDATWPWFGFDERDVWTLFHSYAFDFSVWEVWGALLYGGRVVIVPYEVSRSPEAFHELLARERVTVLNQTPSAFAQLARVDEEHVGALPDLRLVVFGGEALDVAGLAPWFDRQGDERPRLVNMYGITETTVHVTYRPLRSEDASGARRSVIGRRIPDLGLQVLDPWLRPAPVGVPGELAVGGAGLARGYLGRPELTATRFVPDPAAGRPGARLYRSGDLGRFLPDGDLEYLGRIDHQIKIRGFRIELGEIQAAVEAHPEVRQAVVLPHEEAAGERRLVAFVVAQPEREPSSGELRSFLAERLPDYMLPAAFLMLESLPLTQNGKVDRKALLSLPLPGRDEGVAYAPPRTATERSLVEIWQEVLGVERVGIADNFFALGGDSIRSIRVRALAAARGLHFELRDLFRHPTPAELATAVAGPAVEEALDLGPFALVAPEDRERLPDDVEDAYPTSLLQLGMLFHSEREQESTAYHNVSSFVLRAEYDDAALRRAVDGLASRHPVLRTSFDSAGFGEPLQIVHRDALISLETADLRRLSAAEREAAQAARFEEERRRRFDWSRPGLLRFWAYALTGDTFELGMTEHHAILDGWSFSTLLSELFGLYFAELGLGALPPPPPPPTVMRDFVALERAALGSEESRRFWSGQLAGHTFLRLPRRPGRSSAPEPRIQKAGFEIPAETTEALGRAAEAAGVPLKSVLLAAHFRVLERIAGGADLLTGLVANGRPEVEGGERSLGLFLNTLPLRLRPREGATWSELTRAVYEAELELLPYRRFPLAELQRRCSGGPLFEVTFNYTHFHVLENAARLEMLSARLLAETHFVLTVQFSRGLAAGKMGLDLQFDAAELQRPQVQAYGELYLRALSDLARDPGRAWAAEPLLAAGQRQQLVVEWNDSGAALSGLCLHELFEAQADRTPDAVAVVSGETRLTYRELDARANGLAVRLQSLGVGPDALVGLCVERSPEMLVGMLGILKAGGAYVPLDPEYPRERLVFLVEDSGVSVLLTQCRLAGQIPSGRSREILLDGDEAAAPRHDRPRGGAVPDNLAYVIYTSGSTGRPKGVLVRHGGVVNRLLWAQGAYPVTARDRVLHKASFSFDFSVWECFGPLIAGATVVLARAGGQRDSSYLVRTIRAREITLVHFIPSMLQAFVAEPDLEACTSLRYVFSGGEALSLDLQELCLARLPAPLRNQYGPTEISIDTTDWVCRPEDSLLGFVPLGRPLSNTRVHVLDGRLQPVLPGTPGELFVGGLGVARGYWRRPDLTAEKFLPDPLSEAPGARLYRTGDRAVLLPDGNLQFLGRADHQVKIRGFRIEPGEIESALRAHPLVREAAVVARETAGVDRRLVAYVAGQNELQEGELRAFLGCTLPEHMVPSAFVILAALPLSPNGKLDRNALPEPGRSAGPRREIEPPRDELELQLVRLWEDLLDVRPVGIRDDFFALGGHSLLTLRLMGGIERLWGRRVPLSELLQASTVERLADLLRREAAAGHRSLTVPLQPHGSRPPLFLLHPVGGNVLCYLPLARLGSLDGPVYGIQAPSPETLTTPWTVEALADLYAGAIREVAEGPHLLAGWSLGGVLAFETARRLAARGSEVALLAMIDVAPPGSGAAAEPDPRVELGQFLYDLRELAGAGISGPWTWPDGVPADLESLLETEELRRALPPDIGPERLRELFALFGANRRALAAYRPGPYAGPLTLVRAEATAASDPAEGLRGWRDLGGPGSEVHVLPGDHYSLLRPPGVSTLAELLEARIRRALA